MLLIIVCALFGTLHSGTASTVNITLRLTKDQGVARLENPDAIIYENTVPIIYDIQWDGAQPTTPPKTPSTKWRHCSQNTSCLLEKMIQEYDDAVEQHLSKLKIKTSRSKGKRFSIIGWILGECCGIATADQFDHLYQDSQMMIYHLDAMKQTVHANHQSLGEEITNSNLLAEEVSTVVNRTKHMPSETFLKQASLEEKEEILTRSILSIYRKIDDMIQISRFNMASISCQNKRLPASIIDPKILSKDLTNLSEKLGKENWDLAIPVRGIGTYYGVPITSCLISEERLILRIKIPIVRRGRNWRLSNLIPIPVGDSNSTCIVPTPNKKLLSSDQLDKVVFVDNNECMSGNNLCYIPRGLRYFNMEDLKNEFPMQCTNTSDTLVTHIKDDRYAITHPPKKLHVTCSKTSEMISLPVTIHGHLELRVPCHCEVFIENNYMIHDQFPCDSDWSMKMGYYHVIPYKWTSFNQEQVTSISTNESMSYQEKMEKILNHGWEIKKKITHLEPEINPPSSVLQTYKQVRNNLQEFHLEWTTVLSLLIILFLLRKPINLLLVKIVQNCWKPNNNSNVVYDLDVRSNHGG